VLVAGAVPAPGKRTVSAALRIMGLAEARDFALYHHGLSRARWDSRAIARKLLTMILDRFRSLGPLLIGIVSACGAAVEDKKVHFPRYAISRTFGIQRYTAQASRRILGFFEGAA
jgi:hypothetical protein